ncbi:MAG TPA: hypothetical protein VGQ42_12300 [Candidatus Dormibacteraeota bacterium]|jgi:hypothetical protein|nr:hypothetical protein [Candidatus Dormibacteraeota bacterium]
MGVATFLSRRGRRHVIAASVLGTGVLLASPLGAAASTTTTLKAPYASSYKTLSCWDGAHHTAGTCSATATVTASSGHYTYKLSASSPGVPNLDSVGAHTQMSLSATTKLASPAPKVTFTVVVHVKSAKITFSGSYGKGGGGRIDMPINIFDDPCAGNGCQVNTGGPVMITLDGASASKSSFDVTYSATLVNQAGGNLPAGTLRVNVWVDGAVSLVGGDAGTITSSVDATLKSVKVTIN